MMRNKQTFAIKKSTLVQLLIGGIAGLLSLYVVYEVQMVVTLLETSKHTPQSLLLNTELTTVKNEIQDSTSSLVFRRTMR